jgi:PAS domain S-box-containing protein
VAEAALVLCVDDNEGNRYAVVRTLQRAGFRTDEAATGNEALAKVRATRPDLVVLDIQLPDISGFEVCQIIKSDAALASIPVLQVSADFTDVEHRTRGLELGADGYLAHPVEPPELVATVRALLRTRHAEEKARAAERHLRSIFDSISEGIALVDARGHVVECNAGLERMLGRSSTSIIGSDLRSIVAGGAEVRDLFRDAVDTRRRQTLTLESGDRWLLVTCDAVVEGNSSTGAVVVFTDVSEGHRAQEEREQLLKREQGALAALRRSESRFARLAESNITGVLAATLDGRITYANDAFLALIGRQRTDAESGELRWDAITPSGYEAVDARAVEQLRTRGVCEPFEKEYVRADGTRVPVVLAGAVVDAPIGSEVLCFVVDMTERKRLERELRARLDELQIADQRKDEFLAMLAHELRNPLAAITTGMHVLNDVGSTEEKPVRLRATVLRQVGLLTRIVDDLLDVSRITRGKVELRKSPVDVVEAVRNALSTVSTAVEDRRHRVELSAPQQSIWVSGDSTRIEQIVWNLLSNAAKYTEPGGCIHVTVERSGGEAVVRVRDTGIGIDPAMLDHVFELFAQVDQSPARTRGGLGVGLTLVRSLVGMHGGNVIARSQGIGAGSEFEVRLPVLDETPATNGVRAPSREASGRRRLLLVEDNPDIGETLRDLLELLGHRVDLASDGVRGVQMALALHPDAALVDIGLPGIDGYEVARRVRADPGGRNLLLVALTGYGRPEDRDRALEAGFDAHLVKPVDPDELSRLVGELAARRQTTSSSPARTSL